MSGFIFAADLHMAIAGFRKEVPARDGFEALEWLVEEVRKRDIPLVLGGDVFDVSRPPPWVRNWTCRILSRIVDRGLYFIQGNHDKHEDEAWLDGLDGAVRLSGLPVEVGGRQLVGFDYASQRDLLEQLERVDGGVDVVCHQAFKQGLGFDGAWNADLDDKAWRRFRNVWVGDLHHQQELWDKKKKTRAVYPGSIWPRSVNESDCASFIVVGQKEDKKGHVEYEVHELPRRPIVKVSISSDEDLEKLLGSEEFMASICPGTYEGLPETIRKPVLYVKYYKDVLGVQAALQAAQESLGGGIYIEEPMPARTGFAAELEAVTRDLKEAVTLPALITKKVSDHQNVRDFGVELAKCGTMEDVRMRIDVWRDKILNKETA